MAFNIQTFADNIASHGTLQTNKFEVRLYDKILPEGTTTLFQYMKIYKGFDSFETNSFDQGYLIHPDRIESLRLPGMIVDTYETRRYGVGPVIRTGTNARFEPLSISVLTDRDFNIYKFFYTWLSMVFDFTGNVYRGTLPTYMSEYKDLYSTNINCNVYENTGEVKNVYQFREAFPVGISEPTLSWRDNNNLFKFDVTLSYTNWVIDNKPLD